LSRVLPSQGFSFPTPAVGGGGRVLGRDTNTLKDKPLLWTEPGVTSAQGRACLHQPSQGAFSLSCPCAIRPCRRGHSPQGQALFPYPGHNLPTWPWQECLHRDLLCGREGAGTYLWGGASRSRDLSAGPGAAPGWSSGWRVVQHLPGRVTTARRAES